MKKILKKYKGLGFVEALIALAVTGIVGIVLMNIASSSLNELRILDTKDEIEFHAVSTAVNLQKLAIELAQVDANSNTFHDLQDNTCYNLNDDGSIGSTVQKGQRGQYSVIPDTDEAYFRVFCVEEAFAEGGRRVVTRIIVGSTKMRGMATSKTDIKDYEYLAIIFL